MSLTAVASGFVVFVLSVVQGQYDWGVIYPRSHICTLNGSTVEIRCSYRFPSRLNDADTAVEETFWFTRLSDNEPVDLRADSEYSGRVQYHCGENDCTLRITDLRESDSAEYKFRFITNQPGGKYTGEPGVTLSVTGLQVKMSESKRCRTSPCTLSRLTCHSSCPLPDHPSYIWYESGKNMGKDARSFKTYFYDKNSYACAVKGHEDFPSPSVCVHGSSCNRVTYTDRSICAFKGSSVDISCTYNNYESIKSKFWFSNDQQGYYTRLVDLRKDSQYSGRVQVLEAERRSTLRITDLTERDSAEYRFKFKTQWFEWESSLCGTTLTVTDPDVQVQVIWTSTGPKLICSSSCLLSARSAFVWYKSEKEIQGETSPSFRGHVDPEDSYSCAYEGYRSPAVYAPKVSVLMNPSGDVMKDSSVSLTCSIDANPAAKYTWYKENQLLLSGEPQLVFTSVQSSNSGEYYCTAENELGKTTSEHVSLNVKYGPQTSTLSVSPSGEIVEGSSVTLTCSSDANPAANYTWYKENLKLLQGPEGVYHFSSISSEDRGNYYCKSENKHGQINSASLFLDVQYAPKLLSVSVSPSGEIVEGSSVNLTCSSDANPAANYTWYKENEDSPKASGQIFTITDLRPEHSGNYYCEAQNTRGRRNSTLNLTVVAGAWKSAAAGSITAVLLALILLAVFLWIRRENSFTQQCKCGERPDNRAQLNVGPVCDTPSSAAQRQAAGQQDDLHYASICFSQNQGDVVYSNVRVHPQRETEEEEEEEDGVEYSAVRFNNASSAPGTRRQEDGNDSCALYSTVNKNKNTP
ncbi:B-cell receptor CD22-like isoform X2 [Seriola aureovittata]|uniref:B-cell receptor CD22-like isoform X2 n=1 Tax=Seriola aureovittata TaxID=2871759 RepID=UPI0024BD9BFB|nr:B-cell receptor CD22-like isoform X2 [Seriola aureovittata]